MKRKKYSVFLSYNFQTHQGWGFGNSTQFWTNRKYLSVQELREMEQIIAKDYRYKKVVIMNFQFI